jgi:hypothetical protein
MATCQWWWTKLSVVVDHQGIAVSPPRQQAVLDPCRRAEVLNQKQAADQKHQNDNNRREACGLPFGGLIVLRIRLPMVMSEHRTLHRSLDPFNASGSAMEARQYMVAWHELR